MERGRKSGEGESERENRPFIIFLKYFFLYESKPLQNLGTSNVTVYLANVQQQQLR